MTQFDDVCQEQQDKAKKVLLYLKESVGVNSEGINNIKERFHPEKVMNQIQPGEPMLFTKDTISALNSIQSYTNCYPYMDAAHLISKLYELWELQSRKNHAGRQQLTRKIMSMRMDPKADQDLLQMSEILKEEYADCLALSNIGFYRIRVLNDLYNSK